MLIHVISRPLSTVSHVPSSAVRHVAQTLHATGIDVVQDVEVITGSVTDAAAELREHLAAQWRHTAPDVVHTVGVVATMAAVAARPAGTKIVATFDEQPSRPEVERGLARQVDAVVPLSTAEMAHWRTVGAPTFNIGAMIAAAPAVDDSLAHPGGHVVSLATGRELVAIIESMPTWGPARRLVLMGRLGTAERALVRDAARKAGVYERIDYRPGLRGIRRLQAWTGAAALVAGQDGSRHAAYVLEAAAHGVPTVALATGAYEDHIIEGSTGLLVDPRLGLRGLAQALVALLRDQLRCRGLGAGALVRARTLHEQSVLADRLLAIYQQLTGTTPVKVRPAPAQLTAEATALALEYMPLARQLAHRYSGRGQRLEDLLQVASLGLVRAASRFNPDYGTEFHSFAVPTILGELRRHFRDQAWAARVPRSLQEMTLKVQKMADELRASKGTDPTPADIAEALGLLEEEVLQAMQARGEAMSSKSLDHPMGEDGDEAYGDLVGENDADLEYVELRESVREALLRLPEREREILTMRFFGERTQSEIAEQLGLSQVHVSRLITRTLAALREYVTHDVPLPRSWSAEPQEGLAPAGKAA